MAFFDRMKNLLPRGLAYKPLPSAEGEQAQSTHSTETETTSENDESVHGPFVYFAFLMLGISTRAQLTIGLAMLLR
jgi:hypothetical protein